MNEIDKSAFLDSESHRAAVDSSALAGVQAVDPKLAALSDQADEFGQMTSSESYGPCDLAPEGCTYIYNKTAGPSGVCLKQTVGIAETLVNL